VFIGFACNEANCETTGDEKFDALLTFGPLFRYIKQKVDEIGEVLKEGGDISR